MINRVLTDIRMRFTANSIAYKLYLHCSYEEGLRVSNIGELFDVCDVIVKKFKMLSYANVDTTDTFSQLIINNIKFKIENDILLQNSLNFVSTYTNRPKIKIADTDYVKLRVSVFDDLNRNLLFKVTVSIAKI